MSFHPVGASMVERGRIDSPRFMFGPSIPAYQRPGIDARYFGRGIPGMLAPKIDAPVAQRQTYFGRGIPGMLAPHGYVKTLRGVGQLSMPAETQAALKACSDKCDSQFGVPSGKPDFISLTTCFANCNLQYPPTVAVPGGGTVTPPPIGPTATLPPPEVQPPPPPVEPEIEPAGPVAPTKAAASGDMKMWVIGGAVALLAVGAYVYSKKKGR